MGSDPASFDVLSPFRQSLRTHLGEIADEWLGAKVKLVRNISEMIATERDSVKLLELHAQLKSAVISAEDIEALDIMMTKLLDNTKKYAETWVAIKTTLKDDIKH